MKDFHLTIGPFKKLTTRDVPGGPVVRNSGFQFGGARVCSMIRDLRSCIPSNAAKKTQKNPANYPGAFRKKNNVQNFHWYTTHERCTLLLSDSVCLSSPCRKGSTEPGEDTCVLCPASWVSHLYWLRLSEKWAQGFPLIA